MNDENTSTSDLRLITTPSAERALSESDGPLEVEMELLFSCFIRKRVLFPPAGDRRGYPMTTRKDGVNVRFRPVMTRACLVAETGEAPELEDFPIRRVDAFRPRWLKLDWRDGVWRGDFGWSDGP